MKKKRRSFNLLNAIELIEATTVQNYPDDGTGIAQDDDAPPGNILIGGKMKEKLYFNKLTSFNRNWDYDDGEWFWDYFSNVAGQDDFENYSNTLQSMKDLFPEKTWKNVWRRMKNIPDSLATLRFKKANQPYRMGGKDQTGDDKEDHAEINAKKDGAKFKNAKVTNKTIKESSLTERIESIIV